MLVSYHSRTNSRKFVVRFSFLLSLCATATVMMMSGSFDLRQMTHSAQAALRRGTSVTLIAAEPLESQSGAQCEWEPASMTLSATLSRQQRAAAMAADEPRPGTTIDFSQRKPLRMI